MRIFKAEPIQGEYYHNVSLGFLDQLLVRRKKERPDFNRGMFEQDFAGIFNFVNRHSDGLFDIVSNDDELTENLLSNVQTKYGSHSVGETVHEWAEEIAELLIRFGKAYYFLDDNLGSSKIRIVSFSASGVVRLFGTHIQWVPKRRTEIHLDRDDKEISREIRILDSIKVMRFLMPKAMKRMLSAQNRPLAVFDKHHLAGYNLLPQSKHESPNPPNHFDFSVWSDTRARALYRSTRGTGWNCREFGSPKQSDFFLCHRLIRFRRNQLMLRDDILRQLSVELSRVGKGYKPEFSVAISGTEELPSIEQLNELEARLVREEVEFTEIHRLLQ